MQEWCFKVDGFMSLLPRVLAAVNALDKGKQYVLTIKQKTKRRSRKRGCAARNAGTINAM